MIRYQNILILKDITLYHTEISVYQNRLILKVITHKIRVYQNRSILKVITLYHNKIHLHKQDRVLSKTHTHIN